jgi:hypothetical protein
MAKRIVKFIKEDNVWYVHEVYRSNGESLYSSIGILPCDHRWNFNSREVNAAIDALRNNHNMRIRKLKSIDNRGTFNLRISFKNKADEAVFMMLATGNEIVIEDYDVLRFW